MKSNVIISMAMLFSVVVYGAEKSDVETVLSSESVSIQWLELYQSIQGVTIEEKSQHAMTTVEMKAVAVYDLKRQESAMLEVARTLWETLDSEGRDLFLRTHAAWWSYVKLQAEFMTDSGRGGSARSLYGQSVQTSEIKLRTELYRDMLSGKNIFQHKLYIYE